MKKYIFVLLMAMFTVFAHAQDKLKGSILIKENNKILGLDGANVYWLNSQIGTVTNEKGGFTIPFKKIYNKLIINYIGYKSDTLTINSNKEVRHFLIEDKTLDEITITKRKKAISISTYEVKNTLNINSGELLKAACCNLSESFETNPSIDVNFSDAITGTKQIKMLGLTSPYLLITQGNIPSIRGASQAFGLTYTPGTWINSIQITKGTGSVVNGYESISGQINTELKNPKDDDKFFVNAYAALGGRYELNTHFTIDVGKSHKWHTGLYIHGNTRNQKNDDNNDHFLDNPLGDQINILNVWRFHDANLGWESTINFKYLKDNKQSGEVDFEKDLHQNTTLKYGSEIKTNRFETSVKAGKVFEIPYRSLGFQSSFNVHNQNSYYGLRNYEIKHTSFYLNGIYQSIINNTNNKVKMGLSATYDKYDENVLSQDFGRTENSIGGFFEYAYDDSDKLSLVAGLRVDYSNILDFFITPRLHVKYKATDKLTLRGSVGSGKRSATIFSENQKVFASSRVINLPNLTVTNFGLEPEKAWNYGVSIIHNYKILEKDGDISFDFYRTNFVNQVVVDYENPQEVSFYNLDGKSYANSFQLSLNQEIFKKVDLRLAYKYFDVKTDYVDGLQTKPLQPKMRFFANLSHKLKSKTKEQNFWLFDVTYNLIGKQRLPFTGSNPLVYQLDAYTKAYSLMNAQVSKTFNKHFEVYLGGENLTNFTQKNPILASDDPFGTYFDSTIVYAPIRETNYHIGFRYKL